MTSEEVVDIAGGYIQSINNLIVISNLYLKKNEYIFNSLSTSKLHRKQVLNNSYN